DVLTVGRAATGDCHLEIPTAHQGISIPITPRMANTRAIFANLSSMLPPGFENNYEGAIREFSLLREIGGQLIGRVEASDGRRMWFTTGETVLSLGSEWDFASICVSCQYA